MEILSTADKEGNFRGVGNSGLPVLHFILHQKETRRWRISQCHGTYIFGRRLWAMDTWDRHLSSQVGRLGTWLVGWELGSSVHEGWAALPQPDCLICLKGLWEHNYQFWWLSVFRQRKGTLRRLSLPEFFTSADI